MCLALVGILSAGLGIMQAVSGYKLRSKLPISRTNTTGRTPKQPTAPPK
jgi:hypothetical protein